MGKLFGVAAVVLAVGACGGGDDGAASDPGPAGFAPIAGSGAEREFDEAARKMRAKSPPSMLCQLAIVDANARAEESYTVTIANDGDTLWIRCWVTDADGNTQEDNKALDSWSADDVTCKDLDGWHFDIGETWATATKGDVVRHLSCS
jgi:hypothetical protein